MYYEKLVNIRDRLLKVFDKSGIYLDEEDWEQKIQLNKRTFEIIVDDLCKEFDVSKETFSAFMETKELSLEICERIIWDMEKK